MEIATIILKECEASNHRSVKQLLDVIKSYDDRKEIFLKIIDYYENEESRFPVGYVILFLEFLLKNGDLETARVYIDRLDQMGISRRKIADIIYEYLIKRREVYYREMFNRNLELLNKYNILFSDTKFDFDHIKKDIFTVFNHRNIGDVLNIKDDADCLLVDIVDIGTIRKLVDKNHTLWLLYNDPEKFYYMLFFVDMSEFIQSIKEKKILFLVSSNMDMLQKIFTKTSIPYPRYLIDERPNKDYFSALEEIDKLRTKRMQGYIFDISRYYKHKGREYYQELFLKHPSDIRILLITSIHTELNKHIARNWYKALVKLGYNAALLIENEPYERMLTSYIIEKIYELKPDMVFHINFSVLDVFENDDVISRSLLWIMRYRDKRPIDIPKPWADCNNMFVSPINVMWVDELKKIGIPSGRIFYTPEGIDCDMFTRNAAVVKKFECDVVSVNNAGGSELFLLERLLSFFPPENDRIRKVINELYKDLKEMADSEHFIFFFTSFNDLIAEKLISVGIQPLKKVLDIISLYCVMIMIAFYRAKIIEWIVDSKITKNVKVWGRGWSNIKKFRSIHMGMAGYGEELSEIYRSSKITLSEHPHISLHERNFEIFASGGFPLVKNTEQENGELIDCITSYFKENEEVVLFYSKQDLLNKLQYYLDHPGERERIAENGRQVVLKDFSHTAIAGKTMDFIKKYYAAASG